MDADIKLPNLFDYMSAQQYLLDFYNYRKCTQERFSYELWAQELDLNNRNFLRLIVMGKRSISDKFVVTFIKRMNLDSHQAEYFQTMVGFSQAKTLNQKNFYAKKLASLLTPKSNMVELLNYYEFISDTFLPKLHAVLSFDDLKQDVHELSQVMNVSEDVILSSIETLERIGMLKREGDRWITLDKSVRIPDKLGSQVLQNYHKQVLTSAIQAQTLPNQLRKFRSLLVAMNDAELNELFEDMNELAIKIMSKNDHEKMSSRRLFQFNMNVFPVTAMPKENNPLEIL